MKKLFLLFLLFGFCRTLSTSELDKLAIKHGTNKSSKKHDYCVIYEKYFSKARHEEINFLEIGLAECNSAFMWEEYFPNAKLYFIDSIPRFVEAGNRKLSDRSLCFLVDQANKNALMDFVEEVGVKFDFIIDDGGHMMNQQISSFEVLFSYVKSGGVYVIEDLHTSYWKYYGGSGSKQDPKAGYGTTINFLKNLIDDVNIIGAKASQSLRTCPDWLKRQLTFYQENIESIHFYNSVCFIFKR